MTAGKRIRYYGKKLLVFLLSVLVLSLLVFYLARLAPGDPLVAYYGERTEKMSVEERERSLERLGLNDPIYVQYVRWVQNAAQGEFGISYQYKQPVLQVLEGRTGNTLLLGGTGFLLTFALALLVGVFCAWQEERWPDQILCKVGTLTSCIPEFWLCLLFILVFSVTLHWLPSSGAYATGQEGSVASRIQHLILPMAVIVLSHLWYYAYLIRNKILEEVRADYVLLAKAKGLSQGQILFRHCLRNTLPTYFNLMAISVPHILGGTYIIEMVFSYPGIGTLSYESARCHDYNLLMVVCMLTGVVVIFCSILAQILNERIDPRVRGQEQLEYGEVTAL